MLNIYQQQNKDTTDAPVVEPAHRSIAGYQDPTGEFDNKQLAYGMWWLSHRNWLKNFLIGVIIGIAGILWIFSLWRWGVYFWQWNNQSMVAARLSTFPNYTLAHEARSPQQLTVISTLLLPSGVGKNDAVSEVINSNQHFIVSFDYYFTVGGLATAKQHATILPGEDTLVASLGLDEAQYAGDVVLKVDNIAWTRISNHSIVEPVVWQNDRLHFTIANFNFSGAEVADLGVHSVAFSYTNNSAYSYVNPTFYIGLYQHDVLVGVLPLSFAEFKSLETKNVDVRTFVKNIEVDSVHVFPIINVYDSAVYLPPDRF